MGRGELSYSKVRGYRRAQEAKELSREAQQQMNRSVNYWFEDDGSLVLKARLPALAGAMLVRALDAASSTKSSCTSTLKFCVNALPALRD